MCWQETREKGSTCWLPQGKEVETGLQSRVMQLPNAELEDLVRTVHEFVKDNPSANLATSRKQWTHSEVTRDLRDKMGATSHANDKHELSRKLNEELRALHRRRDRVNTILDAQRGNKYKQSRINQVQESMGHEHRIPTKNK